MFKIGFTAPLYDFKYQLYSNALKKAIVVRMKVAGRQFIKAAIARVPIQSGMARGTFLNIGKLLRTAIPIPGAIKGLKYYGPNARGQAKTPALGQSLSTSADEIFTIGESRFSFHYSNDVIHYNINDFFGNIPGTPWLSYEAGGRAFIEEIKRVLPDKIPHFHSFVYVIRVSCQDDTTYSEVGTLGKNFVESDEGII